MSDERHLVLLALCQFLLLENLVTLADEKDVTACRWPLLDSQRGLIRPWPVRAQSVMEEILRAAGVEPAGRMTIERDAHARWGQDGRGRAAWCSLDRAEAPRS